MQRLALSILCLCTLGLAASSSAVDLPPLPRQPDATPYPTTIWPEAPLGDADAAIASHVDALFVPRSPNGLPDTRAVLVVHRGQVVYERYADGFGPTSRFRSFSAAKSVTQALVARLVHDGRLDIDAPAPVPEWNGASDPRRAVTIRHLLNMESGLDIADGGADANSFVGKLLYGRESRDSAGFAARARLIHPPGTHWAYSTGSTQLLSRIVAREVGGGKAGMMAYTRAELVERLGMKTFLFEYDASGTPFGGAYAWMSARDWARLGLLYLRDGVWEGERLFSEDWLAFTRTPGGSDNNSVHGAHFWISAKPVEGQWESTPPELRAFQMNGNGGQVVLMVPERDVIVVRLGEMFEATWSMLQGGLTDIANEFPKEAP